MEVTFVTSDIKMALHIFIVHSDRDLPINSMLAGLKTKQNEFVLWCALNKCYVERNSWFK